MLSMLYFYQVEHRMWATKTFNILWKLWIEFGVKQWNQASVGP